MELFSPLWVGEKLASLHIHHRQGKVHSVFETTINFQTSSLYLFSVRQPDTPRDSWSVTLSDPVNFISLVNPGEKVIFRKDKIVLPKVHFSTLDIPRWRSRAISMITRGPPLTSYMVEDYWSQLPNIDLPLHDEVLGRTKHLVQALVKLDLTSFSQVIRTLLGFGNGTTPAGDDIISGIWMSIHLGVTAKLIPAIWHQTLQKVVLEGERATTDISQDMLLKSSLGYTNEYLEKFIFSLNQQNDTRTSDIYFKNILKLGHSSGIDLLIGFLSGIYALHWKHSLLDD